MRYFGNTQHKLIPTNLNVLDYAMQSTLSVSFFCYAFRIDGNECYVKAFITQDNCYLKTLTRRMLRY